MANVPVPRPSRFYLPLGVFVLLGAGAFASQVGMPSRSRAKLELVEIASYKLPAAFTLTGAMEGSDGSLLYWSSSTNEVFVRGNDVSERIGARVLVRAVAAGFDSSKGTIEVLDPGAGSIWQFLPHGPSVGQVKFSAPVLIDGGAKSTKGWFVVGIDARKAFVVAHIDGDGSIRQLRELPETGGSFFTGHITAVGDTAIISQIGPPYAVFLITVDGKSHTLRSSLDSDTHERLSTGKWVAMPAIRLGNSWIQTFTDLTSDRRLVHTTTAGESRTIEVHAAMALNSASGMPGRVVGARLTTAPEIVIYAWE